MSEGCLRGTTQLKRNGESHCPSTNNAWECSNDVSQDVSGGPQLRTDSSRRVFFFQLGTAVVMQ